MIKGKQSFKGDIPGAGVMAQTLRVLAALAEGWGSVPSTHTGYLHLCTHTSLHMNI